MDFVKLREEWAKTSLARINSNIQSSKEELENLRNDYEIKERELFEVLEQRKVSLARLDYNEFLKSQGDARVEADAIVWQAQKTLLESRYEAITFNNDVITIKTKAVTCETDYPEARGRKAVTVTQLLGKFTVKVHWRDQIVTIEPEAIYKNWTATKGDPAAGDRPLYHPNVFESKPCWGRHGGEVGRMLKDNDINAFLFFIYNFLSSSNHHDQYLRLDATRIFGRCAKCNKYCTKEYTPKWKFLEANIEYGIAAETAVCSNECENRYFQFPCATCGVLTHRSKLLVKKYCCDSCYLAKEGIPCGNRKCKKKILPNGDRFCSVKCEQNLSKCDQCDNGANIKTTTDGINFCSLTHLYQLIRKLRCPAHGEALTLSEFIANSIRIDWTLYNTAKPLGFTCAQHYNQKVLDEGTFRAVVVPWELAIAQKKLPEDELKELLAFLNNIKNVGAAAVIPTELPVQDINVAATDILDITKVDVITDPNEVPF